MKLIYVAGPFRAKSPWEIEQNVRNAESCGRDIVELGAYPVIPHANTRYFHGMKDSQFFLDATLELMRKCDALYMVPGWENSAGSIGEFNEAKRLNIPIFKYYADLTNYLKCGKLPDENNS